MVTPSSRDEEWTHRAMAELFSAATKMNVTPSEWHVGFFCLCDLLKARDPLMRHKRGAAVVRPETAWGCPVKVIMLSDYVALVAVDKETGARQVLVAGEGI